MAGTEARGREAAGTRGAFPSARGLGDAGRATSGGGVREAGLEAAAGARGAGTVSRLGAPREARAAWPGGADRGRPAGGPYPAPFSGPRGPAARLRSRSPTCRRPGAGARVRHRQVCHLLRALLRALLRVHAPSCGCRRLRRGLRGRRERPGPQDVRKRAPSRRAQHKTPFLPPAPRPAPPWGRPRPLAGDARGSGRSRDPLPPLRPFPAAAAARARTCEVGHRSGEEKPGTWREGRRGGEGAFEELEDDVAAGGMEVRQPEGLPVEQGARRRASDLDSKGKDGGSIKNGGGKLFFGGRMRGKGP